MRVYQDVWAGLHHSGVPRPSENDDVMQFAREASVPVWLACTYLGSNVVLNTLNFYWFGKMIETVKKRFRAPPGPGGLHAAGAVIIVEGTEMDGGQDEVEEKTAVEVQVVVQQKGIDADGDPARGAQLIEVHKTEVRKRKA